jgi:hypothetical protein
VTDRSAEMISCELYVNKFSKPKTDGTVFKNVFMKMGVHAIHVVDRKDCRERKMDFMDGLYTVKNYSKNHCAIQLLSICLCQY